MEPWEEQLAREVRRGRQKAAGDAGDGAAAPRDQLVEAFDDLVQRTEGSVERVAKAAELTATTSEEHDAGRYQWTVGSRRLRLRLDRQAQKFFVSLESESGLEMCEIWIEDGRLLSDAALPSDNGLLSATEGAARPVDLDTLVQRFVILLFKGR